MTSKWHFLSMWSEIYMKCTEDPSSWNETVFLGHSYYNPLKHHGLRNTPSRIPWLFQDHPWPLESGAHFTKSELSMWTSFRICHIRLVALVSSLWKPARSVSLSKNLASFQRQASFLKFEWSKVLASRMWVCLWKSRLTLWRRIWPITAHVTCFLVTESE